KAGTKEEKEDTRNLTIGDIAHGDDAALIKLIHARYPSKDTRDIEAWLNKFTRAPELVDLAKRASSGVPPPSPVGPEGRRCRVNLKGEEHRFSYSWVEIGKSELHTLGLNNEARTSEDPRHSGNWRAAAAVRASGNVLEVRMNGLQVGAPPGNYNTLLYSRK